MAPPPREQPAPPTFFRRLFRLRSRPAVPLLTTDGLLPSPSSAPPRIFHRKAARDLGRASAGLSPSKLREEEEDSVEEREQEERGRNREKRTLGSVKIPNRASAIPIPIPVPAPSISTAAPSEESSLQNDHILPSPHFHPRSNTANALHGTHHIPSLHLSQHNHISAEPSSPPPSSPGPMAKAETLTRSLRSSPSCSSFSYRSASNSSSLSSTSSSLASAASMAEAQNDDDALDVTSSRSAKDEPRGRSTREKDDERSSELEGQLDFENPGRRHSGLSTGIFPPSKSTTPNLSPPAANSLTLSFVRPFARPSPSSKTHTPRQTPPSTTRLHQARSFPVVLGHDEDGEDEEAVEAPRGRARTRGRHLS